MRYCVIKNIHQEEQLKELAESHDKIASSKEDNFMDLITDFVKYIKGEKLELLKNPYIYPIFLTANQVVYSFRKFKEAKNEQFFKVDKKGKIIEINLERELDKQEIAMVLVFFMNAKAFVDLIKKYTKIKIDDVLDRDITNVRNYLAHFYDKDIGQKKYFASLSIERGLREYSVLQAFDVDSGEATYEVSFSLDLFYFSLKDIFGNLKNNPSLFV